MKIEALNCPNCGAAVSSDSAECRFCGSRLKTVACPACFGLMFSGSAHCPRCGEKAVAPQILQKENLGNCPRCKVRLSRLQIERINLRECEKCGGLWAAVETFETICAERESRAAVLDSVLTAAAAARAFENKSPVKVNYVPCPDCKQLMNRSNFAASSGVIIDLCKKHGVWFDVEELPKIVEFVRQGGLDRARRKEKLHLEDERSRLRFERYQLAAERNRIDDPHNTSDSASSLAIREFIGFLFD